ncbi:hypothetical protein HMPREF9570_00390 [Cutibacterium acnes HL043PA1]|nr:hypothetical protein HMPREF9570_00390 [Cutibacterium acnes HL043PA1]
MKALQWSVVDSSWLPRTLLMRSHPVNWCAVAEDRAGVVVLLYGTWSAIS